MSPATATAMPVGAGMAQTGLSLLLVLGAILALAWLLRRVQAVRGSNAGAMSIRAGLQVGARERVLWIRAGGKDLLIGVAAGRVQTLHVFDQAPDEEPPAATPPGFREVLQRIAQGRKS